VVVAMARVCTVWAAYLTRRWMCVCVPQYPRGYQHTASEGDRVGYAAEGGDDLFLGAPTTSQCIMDREATQGCTMGYTVVTRVDGCEYRCESQLLRADSSFRFWHTVGMLRIAHVCL
jgi:hypothetical protein